MMKNGLVDRLTSNILRGVAAGFVALGSYACGGDGKRITDPPIDTTPPTIIHANFFPLIGMPPLEVTGQILCEDDGGIRDYTLVHDVTTTRSPLPIDTELTFMRSGDPIMSCTDTSGNSSSYSEHVEIVPREFIGQIAFSMLGTIWVVNEDGSGFEQLTNGPQDIEPDFSPDGKYLAFSTNRNGNWEIYIRDMDDGSLFRLTEGIHFSSQPVFSPDGKQILFSYDLNIPGRGAEIGSINVDGTNLTSITLEAGDFSPGNPNWSPDGIRIVFDTRRNNGGWEIYTVHAKDISFLTNITNTIKSVYDAFPDWSMEEPTEERIVFVRDSTGVLDGLFQSEIYTMNPNGSNIIQLTNNSARESNPKWILNGTKILFLKRESPSTTLNLWVMDEDGTNERMIYESSELTEGSLGFRPR